MRTIAIVGPHRVGKTTICERLEAEGFPFFRTNVSGTFERLGVAPDAVRDMNQRIEIQHEIMDDFNLQLREFASGDAIQRDTIVTTDRSPLDFAMYTISDVLGSSEVDDKAFQEYIERCFYEMQRFTQVIHIQPGIPLVAPEGKKSAALNKAYIEHLNFVMLGLIHENYDVLIKSRVIQRDMIDLDNRMHLILTILREIQ